MLHGDDRTLLPGDGERAPSPEGPAEAMNRNTYQPPRFASGGSGVRHIERTVIIDTALDLHHSRPASGHVDPIPIGGLSRYWNPAVSSHG